MLRNVQRDVSPGKTIGSKSVNFGNYARKKFHGNRHFTYEKNAKWRYHLLFQTFSLTFRFFPVFTAPTIHGCLWLKKLLVILQLIY